MEKEKGEKILRQINDQIEAARNDLENCHASAVIRQLERDNSNAGNDTNLSGADADADAGSEFAKHASDPAPDRRQ